MTDLFSGYERGVEILLERLGKEHHRYAEGLVLQLSLMENIVQTRRYGDTETQRAERARIVDALNRIAMECLNISFNEIVLRTPTWDELQHEYLDQVADVYSSLRFPIGHFSRAIDLDEVFVNVPLVKLRTEEIYSRHISENARLSGDIVHRPDTLLQRTRCAALVGDLGAGKSTILQYLGWLYSRRPSDRVYWKSQDLIPFVAQLRDLKTEWPRKNRSGPEQFVAGLAKAVSFGIAGIVTAQDIEQVLTHALENSNALVLLDALDELKTKDEQQDGEETIVDFATAIQDIWASRDFRHNHLVVSSRPYLFPGSNRFERYGLQNLDETERLVFRLGRVVLCRDHDPISEQQIQHWLKELNQTVHLPRFRDMHSPFYVTLMILLGTSGDTFEASLSRIRDVRHVADLYEHFLYQVIKWEETKGRTSVDGPEEALLILAYTALQSVLAPTQPLIALRENVMKASGRSAEQVRSIHEFWKGTGLLHLDSRAVEFRHAGFQSFGTAFALVDMLRHGQKAKVDELWAQNRWNPEWRTTLELLDVMDKQ